VFQPGGVVLADRFDVEWREVGWGLWWELVSVVIDLGEEGVELGPFLARVEGGVAVGGLPEKGGVGGGSVGGRWWCEWGCGVEVERGEV
jgi:hypothetical protein